MIDCKYCGRHIPYDANVCPYCGRSIRSAKDGSSSEPDSSAAEPRQYVDTASNQPERSNLWLYVIIIILLLLLLSFAAYFFLHRTPAQEEEASPADTTVVYDAGATDSGAQPSQTVVGKEKLKKEIIVNGEGVRMRFGPSLKAGYLKTSNGGTLSVKKGTRLPCLGEEGDWYKISYQGKQYYMSKEFCIPAK